MAQPANDAKNLPVRPGVYLFRNQADEVIYVGKAKKLRLRVSSYFRPGTDLTPAKAMMVKQIARLEAIMVSSETEALLLESTLIKKYRPKYNIILKDDKFFQYIRINLREDFPSVTTVRRLAANGGRYYGPYPSGSAVRETMRLLKRLFPYKSCANQPDQPCFDYQLGRCLGHDTGPGSQERYHVVVRQMMDFLNGHTGPVLKDLRRDMKRAAKARDYEAAARFRDRLQALEHVLEQRTVITASRQSFDIISLARSGDLAAVNLFQIRDGKLSQRDQFLLQHVRDRRLSELVSAFAEQYYAQSTTHPATVITPVAVPAALATSLQINFRLAARGAKRKLLKLGEENAAEFLKREHNRHVTEAGRTTLALSELAHALNLPAPPKRIEMYDASNFQGVHAVASMVVFEDGLPKPTAYRKFAIRNQAIPDDAHRLAEVLQRRFARRPDAYRPGRGGPARHDDRGWPLPDLLMLDGGIPQLNVVLRAVPGLGHHVRLAALAKEHEEIFLPGQRQPIRLPEGSQELFLVQRIRDEAHRFAIGYYRRKHRQETLRSILDGVPGLGPQGKKLLLAKFGTLDAIHQAPDKDLVELLGDKRAEALREQLG